MRTDLVRKARGVLLMVTVVGILVAAAAAWQTARAGIGPAWLRRLASPPQVLAGRHIGIVAGHGGNDPGTVCSDGLTEASVNAEVARLAARQLARYGAVVEVLEEFDERLPNYQADAFVSIHTDSCQADPELSGYKVAGSAQGSPDSASLADCLWDSYERATGLTRNTQTIDNMREYHAFDEIAASTPAAIIEIGFLRADRVLLTSHPQRAADGIAVGLECFLAAGE